MEAQAFENVGLEIMKEGIPYPCVVGFFFAPRWFIANPSIGNISEKT